MCILVWHTALLMWWFGTNLSKLDTDCPLNSLPPLLSPSSFLQFSYCLIHSQSLSWSLSFLISHYHMFYRVYVFAVCFHFLRTFFFLLSLTLKQSISTKMWWSLDSSNEICDSFHLNRAPPEIPLPLCVTHIRMLVWVYLPKCVYSSVCQCEADVVTVYLHRFLCGCVCTVCEHTCGCAVETVLV